MDQAKLLNQDMKSTMNPMLYPGYPYPPIHGITSVTAMSLRYFFAPEIKSDLSLVSANSPTLGLQKAPKSK